MKILKYGSEGPSVQLLQLALNRAGYGTLETAHRIIKTLIFMKNDSCHP